MSTKSKKIKLEKGMSSKDVEKEINKRRKKAGHGEVVLIAKKVDDTVNGYIKTYIEGDFKIVDVHLYQEDKDPDFEIYKYKGVTYNRGSKITIRKADQNTSVI